MKCPYCDNQMLKGDLYGSRVKLKWIAKDAHK
ncbi:PF20097 family protein [Clostridium estertheticum]